MFACANAVFPIDESVCKVVTYCQDMLLHDASCKQLLTLIKCTSVIHTGEVTTCLHGSCTIWLVLAITSDCLMSG